LMGAFLGWIFIATGNLLPVIICHGLYDFLALAYLTRIGSR
jgi:membrane protease YdiL (CAAX protease family)